MGFMDMWHIVGIADFNDMPHVHATANSLIDGANRKITVLMYQGLKPEAESSNTAK